MRRNEENTMTVDQENRIIRKCDHVKSIGAMAVYVDTGCRKANMIKGMTIETYNRYMILNGKQIV